MWEPRSQINWLCLLRYNNNRGLKTITGTIIIIIINISYGSGSVVTCWPLPALSIQLFCHRFLGSSNMYFFIFWNPLLLILSKYRIQLDLYFEILSTTGSILLIYSICRIIRLYSVVPLKHFIAKAAILVMSFASVPQHLTPISKGR